LADPLKIRTDQKAQLSQANIRPASFEQWSTEFRLQCLNGTSERGLCDAAAVCRPGEALFLAKRDKVEDLVYFDRHISLSARQF
jgi:hypothetical protein